MGKDEASILGGDDESDVLWTLLEICGFDTEGYLEISDDEDIDILSDDLPPLIPTRENLNAQLLDPYSELHVLLSRCKIGYLEFLILGVLILKTGAILPPELKARILETSTWKTEEWRWKKVPEKFRLERKKALQYFRSKVENHIDGQISASLSDFWF